MISQLSSTEATSPAEVAVCLELIVGITTCFCRCGERLQQKTGTTAVQGGSSMTVNCAGATSTKAIYTVRKYCTSCRCHWGSLDLYLFCPVTVPVAARGSSAASII